MGGNNRTIQVLFASSEADPFYKVGGLGDYAGSLPIALKKYFAHKNNDLDIRVVLPLHDLNTVSSFSLKKTMNLVIPGQTTDNICDVYAKDFGGIPHYFIRQVFPQPESEAVYGHDQYQTAYKFALFSIAVLRLIKELQWAPDIIHTNDWHTALINYLVWSDPTPIGMNPGTLLTIHNMPYMGYGSEPVYNEFSIKPVPEKSFPKWAQNLPLPMGIASADRIVAVSPSYARELTTNYFAYGLENYFLSRPEKLSGIINGIDYENWDPISDPAITHPFSVDNLSTRKKNKEDLFHQIGFENELDQPLLIVISRLENQKGIDLILDALAETAELNWKAVILGSGHHGYEYAFKALEHALPKKVHTRLKYDPTFARKLYASGDMILMPSLYEPCGLSQMIAMRYGCVPIAHAVGGLKDSIAITPEDARTGFLFNNASKEPFIACLKKALNVFDDPTHWMQIQKNGMHTDFSWLKSAASYAEIYRQIIAEKNK